MTRVLRRERIGLTELTIVWWLMLVRAAGTTASRLDRARGDTASRDRGDVVSTTALAVGMVLVAGFVVFAMRDKAETIVGNVCTNTDPGTC
jgi:hypothetical protein